MVEEKILKRDFDNIRLDLINPQYNIRTEAPYRNLEELKTSIKRIGLIHPITVVDKKGKYDLLAGQRRVLAFEQLDFTKIPAIIINDLDETSKKILALTENLHRRALPYGDTVRVCDELFNTFKGPKNKRIERMAIEIGISIHTISKYLGYRLIPQKVKDMVDAGKLTHDQAYKITTAFWPNSEKILKIADYTAKAPPKQAWERALDIGMKKKDASVEEILEEASKAPETYKLTLQLDRDNFKVLTRLAKKRSDALKRKISVEELITDLISDFISKGD